VLSVPAGFSSAGLPIGLQLASNHFTDMQLLRYGRAFEQQTGYAAVAPVVSAGHKPLTTVSA
jgi:amidase